MGSAREEDRELTVRLSKLCQEMVDQGYAAEAGDGDLSLTALGEAKLFTGQYILDEYRRLRGCNIS